MTVVSPPVRVMHVMTAPQSLYFFLRGQIEFMRAKGVDAYGVASPGRFLEKFASRDNVETTAIDMPRRISPLHDAVAIAKLWWLMRRVRPDFVQAGTPKGGLLGVIAASLARVPVTIYHIRGLPLTSATGRSRVLYRWTERISCRLADHVLCVSPSLREVIIAEGLCAPEKISTLGSGSGNGVDAENRFNPAAVGPDRRREMRRDLGIPDEAVVVGFVGRLIGKKGVEDLVNAWALLQIKFPSAHLLVIGPFEEQDPIPPQVKDRLAGDATVHRLDFLEDTVSAYAAMDIFVLPTKFHEGLPNVLLEASAMELPVVTTTIPGCRDVVVDGSTGFLLSPGDVAALANAIGSYIASPELRRDHGRAGRTRVLSAFRPEDIWNELYKTYVHLLSNKNAIAR